MQKILDTIERVGNSVPHPVVIFLILIAIVLVLSHLLYMFGASVTYQVINPDTHKLETATTAANSLLTVDGIRHIYTRLVPNFMGFSAVGLLVVAMMGVGVAEEAGLVNALIRKLVTVSPSWALVYIIAFVGIISSIAADAGYVVLIPLAGVAFLSVGRHPLAGLAVGFAGVAGAFTVNMIIKPLDAVLTELTNDAIRMVNPNVSLDLTANVSFSIASVVVLTAVIGLINNRIIEPRLGIYEGGQGGAAQPAQDGGQLSADESRGLRYAAIALLGVVILFLLLTLPSGAPLRNPETGILIGNSPFMNGLIGVIMVLFLATGIAYGMGAKTMTSSSAVIAAMTKAVSSLGGTILLFVVISQFVDYFNYSNIPTLMALTMADALKSANIGALWLLVGFIVVVMILDLVFTPAIAKWAIFAPVFVPVFIQLSVDPAAVLAAYRIADSPVNAITPLNAYFAMVVGFAQNYDKNAGVGTVVALMLPYTLWMAIIWTALFVVWYLLGLPWGL
ncbi:AbgT family transporter [Bradyrhizobium lablabi]|nr:AbgT family transporter [Bradyrhizobium lablabi]